MAWNALIMRFGDAKNINDFPSDFMPPPVATAAGLKATLLRLFPNAEHGDKRSSLEGEGFWLELNHGCHTDQDGNVSAVGVRSNAGHGAIQHLKLLCEALDARLLDIQTNEFADFSDMTASSMDAFSAWRDRTMAQIKESE